MGNPTEELRARLDELGVEYDTYDLPNGERGVSWIDGNGIEWEAVQRGENFEIHALQLVTPEQAIAATVGKDIERYDGSGRRGTVAILQGGRKPEEVLFVRYEGGVTHYLPENVGTCKGEIDSIYFECKLTTFKCHSCGWSGIVDNGYAGYSFGRTDMPRHCPNCGAKVMSE